MQCSVDPVEVVSTIQMGKNKRRPGGADAQRKTVTNREERKPFLDLAPLGLDCSGHNRYRGSGRIQGVRTVLEGSRNVETSLIFTEHPAVFKELQGTII